MKNFILYKVNSDLEQTDIYKKATKLLSDFEWRKGDSDSQGKYISGRNLGDVVIKIWLGDAPAGMTVSFRLAWENDKNRTFKKDELISLIETTFIPSIGEILKKTESE